MPDRTLAASGLILIYAVIIGFTDNFVRVIADEAGLWQFHATRSVMAVSLLAAVAVPLGLRLRPVSWRAVAARSAIHGAAMLIYFGALAFLPVAQVAAGLFTAAAIRGELHDLASGAVGGRRDDAGITLFKSVGAAIEDLTAASLLVHA